LLTNVKVQAAVQAAMDARSDRTKISTDYVLTAIQDTVERCRQAKPVTYRNGDLVLTETPEGKDVPAYAFDSSAVLRGCELLGKHLKLFTDKVEHSGNVDFSNLSPDERDKRLRYLEAMFEQSKQV
jgi:phage terminase small subunit